MKEAIDSRTVIHILLIIILGLLAYSNTFHVPFHFDDIRNIVENYKLRDLSNFWPPSGSRWFGFLTFALNYKLGTLNVTGYHIVNLTVHIINALLVYGLVVLTLRIQDAGCRIQETRDMHRASWIMHHHLIIALFPALLFVSHPVQTQAVTYIVQRFTSLATMFYLLSVFMYIKARLEVEAKVKKNSIFSASTLTFYLLSLFSAIFAMKTKEIAFTLPFIIILYEFCFFSKSPDSDPESSSGRTPNLKRFLFLLPFLLTLLIIPLSMIGIDKPIEDAIGELREAAQETEDIPRWSYLFTQFRVLVTYIRLLFLPINQNLDYDYPIYHSFLNIEVFLSFLFLLSILILGIYLLYRSRISQPPTRYTLPAARLISFGIFWFFITLSVESSIIPIRDVIFEHRLYLPSVGIVIAFASAVFYYTSRFTVTLHVLRATRYMLPLLFAVIISFSSVATYHRNIVWKDEVSLWEDVVKKSPNKARGYNNLGLTYKKQGRLDEAIQEYKIALRLKPDNADIYYNLGIAYQTKGLIDKAIEQYQIAIRLKPDYSDAHNNLGIAYRSKGLIDMAIGYCQIAIRLKPDDSVLYYNLGTAYQTKGLIDKAIEQYLIAIKLNPNDQKTYNNLGTAYQTKGLIDKAIEQYQIAIKLNPNDQKTYNNLVNAYLSKGLIVKAIEQYQIAIKLNPNDPNLYYNLGDAYFSKGMIDKAIEQYEFALNLKPNDPDVYDKLGVAYRKKGLSNKAKEHFQIAETLRKKTR